MDIMMTAEKQKEGPSWDVLFPHAVSFDQPGYNYTSMGVGGKIDRIMCPRSASELGDMVSLLRTHHIPYTVVGNWTNLIVTDKGFRGALIWTKNLDRVWAERDKNHAQKITAQAGALLMELVGLTMRENLTGLEFCGGIPGTVGGAVRMNAGAYGHSVSESIVAVTLMDGEGRTRAWEREDLFFEYRNVHLSPGHLIVDATFQVFPAAQGQVEAKVSKIMADRMAKHPLNYKNAGSIFKNPKNHAPAGHLIEEAGLKGYAVGDAAISEKHGNFIINRGGASAADILALIEHVQETIFLRYGILLEPEIKVIGEQ
ncbi:MAG: UDP-N-acetylmuramate dehydrogenase [Syntrophobacterales bacterium]|jgi:UDP-N-acetylmuramate dehydrogenase|nr:UDP-N-acetylmuramate dehydrogenase [Syntrophobacterales bacterium]